MPHRGSKTSSSKGSSLMESSTAAALLKLSLLIFPGFASATSSRALRAGRMHCSSPSGPTTAKCGPALRRASLSRKQASSSPRKTNGIYGPTYFDCSVPEGQLRSLESRLRQRLASVGSTECLLTWKASVTPAGRSYSRLVPSTPRTVETASTLSGTTPPPPPSVALMLWITASARDWKDTPGMSLTRSDGRSRVDQLPRQATTAVQKALKDMRMQITMQPTPTASEHKYRLQGDSQQSKSLAAISILTARGAVQHSSSVTTEKLGALNPQFPCWLMGFPLAWDACAPSATPSSRRSPRK